MFATTIFGYTLSVIWLSFLVFIWVFVAIWPAMIAARKGRNFYLWLLFSLFFWWITLFVVIFMKDESGTGPAPTATA